MKISTLFRVFVAAGLLTSIPISGAHAESIETIPTGWRIENYIGASGVVAWFTGSTCTNGQLVFNSSATADDKNRFWTLVMTAKIAGKPIGVIYTNVSGSCQIASFYLKEQ